MSYDDGLVTRFGSENLPGKMRYAGAFVIDGTFVSSQRLRGMIGRREQLYDIAGCVLINQECGAEIRYANGDLFDIEPLIGGKKIDRPWLMFPRESGFKL